jgi:hypothetical protein
MAHPGSAGTGLWSSDWSLPGSLPPFGQRSLVQRLIQPEGGRWREVRRVAAWCQRSGRAWEPASYSSDGIEIRETPVMEHDDPLRPTLRHGWRAVGIP